MSVIFYSDIVQIIKNREVKGSKFGLERTKALLKAFGSPDEKLKIVHVAGSNGKGSTAAFIADVLRAAGYKVGTFTSPEVYSYADKFLFDGAPSEALVKYYLSEVYSASLEAEDPPTAFEIETAAALAAFAAAGCEYAVMECGLGGRDDATNAVSRKEVAVLSSVSLEHTAILGGTVAEICANKAGIVRDCPVVVNALQTAEGRAYFERLNPIFAGDGLQVVSRSLHGQTFTYRGAEYFIRLTGDAQCYNAATAIETARVLGIGDCKIAVGLATTEAVGRNQAIEKNGVTYILDGSHNPAAFAPLCDILKTLPCEKTLVFGCLSDKDAESAARILSPYFSSARVFSPPSYRAMDVGRIYGAFCDKIGDVKAVADVREALEEAKGGAVVVCGSFTALKEAKQWIEQRL